MILQDKSLPLRGEGCSSIELPEQTSLLFGEVQPRNQSSNRTCLSLSASCTKTATEQKEAQNPVCNLILTSSSTFLRFWLVDEIRNNLLNFLDMRSRLSLRLVCQDFSNRIAPAVFNDIHVEFGVSTFTKPARIAALERIGHHVKAFTLSIVRNHLTTLPPLVDPLTGEEISFSYNPATNSTRTLKRSSTHPSFDSWHISDLLIKQYPPLFHAATNAQSFVKAFSKMPNLHHVRIHSPSLETQQQGPRSITDYALVSLRIAIERATLPYLSALSFTPIHPEGLLYMQPILSIGASPRSALRWAQIYDMTIHLDSPAESKAQRSDQLKMLHTYLRSFASSLTKFHFKWEGSEGPSPISLDTEPGLCMEHASSEKQCLRSLKFTFLHSMQLENAVTDATQIRAFIDKHRKTLQEFSFERVRLRSGDWDDALSPMLQVASASALCCKGHCQACTIDNSVDVPIIFSRKDKCTPNLEVISAPDIAHKTSAPKPPIYLDIPTSTPAWLDSPREPKRAGKWYLKIKGLALRIRYATMKRSWPLVGTQMGSV